MHCRLPSDVVCRRGFRIARCSHTARVFKNAPRRVGEMHRKRGLHVRTRNPAGAFSFVEPSPRTVGARRRERPRPPSMISAVWLEMI